MSFLLTLLPLRGPQELNSTCVSCYERLMFDQDYSILGQLIDLSSFREDELDDIPEKPTIKSKPIPPQMWVKYYEDEGIELIRKDKYNTELRFVYAQQLKKLKMPDKVSPKDKAVKAFIDALPNKILIILYWH